MLLKGFVMTMGSCISFSALKRYCVVTSYSSLLVGLGALLSFAGAPTAVAQVAEGLPQDD